MRVQRRLAAANANVVAIEGDVDRAEVRRLAGALLDQPGEALCEWNAARLDPDEGDLVQAGVRLDDLVRDARERPRKRVGVEESLARGLHRAHSAGSVAGIRACVVIRLLPGLTGPA